MKKFTVGLIPKSGVRKSHSVDGLDHFVASHEQPRFGLGHLPARIPLGMYRLTVQTPDASLIDDASFLVAYRRNADPIRLDVAFAREHECLVCHFVIPEGTEELDVVPLLLGPMIRIGPVELRRVSTTMWRAARVTAAVRRSGGFGKVLSKALDVTKREGFRHAVDRMRSTISGTAQSEEVADFAAFERRNHVLNRVALEQAGFASEGERPTLSLIVPIFRTPPAWLNSLLRCIDRQSDQELELVLVFDGPQDELEALVRNRQRDSVSERIIVLDENRGVSAAINAGLRESSGDYIVVLDHDDWIDPLFVEAFRRSAAACVADIYYADEIVTDGEMRTIRALASRGRFDIRFYMSHPYIVHPIFVRRQIALSAGGFDEALSVSQDVDFFLRCVSKAEKVVHIPLALYAWRTHESSLGHQARDDVARNTREALQRFVEMQYGWADAAIRETENFNVYEVLPPLPADARAAIIIPTKNRKEILALCLASINARRSENRTAFDIFVIDHESSEDETLDYLQKEEEAGRITVLRYEGPWNYSAINNEGVRRILARDNYSHLVFMNNDIELITPDWLDRMMAQFSYGDVGVVGCCLLYPDARIQHGGVIVGMFGAAEHSHKFQPMLSPATGLRNEGHLCSLVATRDYDAVTGAAMIVPTAIFNAVGGFDEKLAVGFNDTDLCLRIKERGYSATYVGQVTAIHFESVSRGKSDIDPHPADSLRFTQTYADEILYGDPTWGRLLKWRSNLPEMSTIPEKPFRLREHAVRRSAPGSIH